MTDFLPVTKRTISAIRSPFVIDVRTPEDIAATPTCNITPQCRLNASDLPPTCSNVRFDSEKMEIHEEDVGKLPVDKETNIIVHCYRGRRAEKVCKTLSAMGYTNLTNGKNAAYILSAITTDGNVMIRQLFDRESCTYTYLLMDKASHDAVLIDPVLELVERDMAVVSAVGAKLKYILNTHVHADHITGSGVMKAKYAAQGDQVRSVISKESTAKADKFVTHGDVLYFGEQTLQVRSTPGHTPGCVAYILNESQGHVFCGDTVLVGGCGRTDFQGGDPNTLFDSVWNELFSLPEGTVLYPGHDYKGRTCSTVGEEKRLNSRLTKPKDEFVELMNELFDGSNYPKKLDVSLPANLVCGVQD